MELDHADQAVAQASALLAHCRTLDIPVVHVQHIANEPDAPFFRPATQGAEIHHAVLPQAGERLVVKHHANSFRETSLLADLRALGTTQLVVAGMMTYMCVDSTVRAASDLGFECTLAHDACATPALELAGETVDAKQVQTAYIAGLNDGFAKVLSTTEVCNSLA